MSQTEQPLTLPRLELLGKNPPRGEYWCATCAFFYMGALNTNVTIQQEVKALAQKAMEAGENVIYWKLPEVDGKILRQAVTIAPSVAMPWAAPVCWVHLKGEIPVPLEQRGPGQAIAPSTLLTAKDGNWRNT
jgi:hypothetical protein